MRRLWELAAIGLGLVISGALLTAQSYPAEQRAAALGVLLGAFLLMARTRRD